MGLFRPVAGQLYFLHGLQCVYFVPLWTSKDQSTCGWCMNAIRAWQMWKQMHYEKNQSQYHTSQTGQRLNQGLRDDRAATNRHSHDAQSLPSNAQDINRRSHTPTPPYAFMACIRTTFMNLTPATTVTLQPCVTSLQPLTSGIFCYKS
jgi:hypothetical protein